MNYQAFNRADIENWAHYAAYVARTMMRTDSLYEIILDDHNLSGYRSSFVMKGLVYSIRINLSMISPFPADRIQTDGVALPPDMDEFIRYIQALCYEIGYQMRFLYQMEAVTLWERHKLIGGGFSLPETETKCSIWKEAFRIGSAQSDDSILGRDASAFAEYFVSRIPYRMEIVSADPAVLRFQKKYDRVMFMDMEAFIKDYVNINRQNEKRKKLSEDMIRDWYDTNEGK